MPTSGTRPLSAREQLERPAVEARDDRHVDVARAPAAALGEQHHRQPPPLGDLEQAVLLQVVAHALGAGEDRVVVGHRHAAARRRSRRPRRRGRRRACARSAPRAMRRCSWAANSSGPYSTKLPSSSRSARFSRAVRRPRSWRRATASGRAASRPTSWRSRTACRSARSPLGVALARRRRGGAIDAVARRRASAAAGPPRRRRRRPPPARAITPSISASTSCSIFIASSTTSGAPAPTCCVAGCRDRDDHPGERRGHGDRR